LKRICDELLLGRYDLEVVDLFQNPSRARDDLIIAAPTLVRESPLPERRMIGNLSDRGRVLHGLGL
jgi:circadian clock protein KaiB